MINLFKNALWHIMLEYVPWIQEICNKVVHMEPRCLEFVPNHFKTQRMCNEAIEVDPYTLRHVPDHLKTQRMCERGVENDSDGLDSSRTILRPKRCVKRLLKMSQGP